MDCNGLNFSAIAKKNLIGKNDSNATSIFANMNACYPIESAIMRNETKT